MASPGKSSDKNPQGTGGSGNAGGGSPPQHPPRPAETENVPPPPPEQQGEGGEGVTDLNIAATETQATETVTIPVEIPAEKGPQRKRDRVETAGASGSGEKKHKKKGELIEIPSKPPFCYVCNRKFHSWKAVFGHMRAHKVGEERARAGAFPPPEFTPPGSPERAQQALQEQLVPTLINIAQDVLNRPTEAAAGSSSVAAAVQGLAGSSSSRPDIDLNLPQEPSPAASAPTSPTKGGANIDLNMPPSDNNGDDDDNAGAGTA